MIRKPSDCIYAVDSLTVMGITVGANVVVLITAYGPVMYDTLPFLHLLAAPAACWCSSAPLRGTIWYKRGS